MVEVNELHQGHCQSDVLVGIGVVANAFSPNEVFVEHVERGSATNHGNDVGDVDGEGEGEQVVDGEFVVLPDGDQHEEVENQAIETKGEELGDGLGEAPEGVLEALGWVLF